MGSVNVIWRGSCQNRTTQDELIDFLKILAERSAERVNGVAPERPRWLEVLTDARAENTPLLDPVRIFNHEITGRILLEPHLAVDLNCLREEVQHTKTVLAPVEPGGMEKREEFCLSLSSTSPQYFLQLSRLRLYGIDFRLFDPRNLYPNSDRMSFVFIESPDLSALNGCLAQVEDPSQCRLYSNEEIRSADWFVSTPTIHLRYYLEEWSDCLFSWVKYFFIPNLYYWRYEDLPHYETIPEATAKACQDGEMNDVRQSAFEYLLDRFEQEIKECEGWLVDAK